MILGTASVCLTVLVLNMHHRDVERPIPRWARVLVLNNISRFLCVRARKPKTMRNNLKIPLLDRYEAANAELEDGLRHVGSLLFV